MEAASERAVAPFGEEHAFLFLLDQLSVTHGSKGRPGTLSPEQEKLWQEAMKNPDYMMYPHIYNILTMKGQHMGFYFNTLIDPFDKKKAIKKAEENFKKIKVPTYTGAGWYAYTYKLHLQGSQHWYANIDVPKKLLFTGPAHLERPFHSFHGEILRW